MVTNFEQLFEYMRKRGLSDQAMKVRYEMYKEASARLDVSWNKTDFNKKCVLQSSLTDLINALFDFCVISPRESCLLHDLLR